MKKFSVVDFHYIPCKFSCLNIEHHKTIQAPWTTQASMFSLPENLQENIIATIRVLRAFKVIALPFTRFLSLSLSPPLFIRKEHTFLCQENGPVFENFLCVIINFAQEVWLAGSTLPVIKRERKLTFCASFPMYLHTFLMNFYQLET